MRNGFEILGILMLLCALIPQRQTFATGTDTGVAPSSPLHLAVQAGDATTVRRLLDGGAAVDPPDDLGRTPLHYAAIAGNVDVAGLLLDRGADPNARAAYQMTPLHYASMLGRAEMAGLLVRRGSRTDAKNARGATPLHLAADEKVVKVLIAAGADLSARDKQGSPPLHTARQGSVARALLDNKADMRLRNNMGKTSMEIAAIESLEPAGLSLRSLMIGRLRGLIGAMPLTMTNIHAQPMYDIEVTGHSPACDVEPEPARVERLLPGEAFDLLLTFIRSPSMTEGEYPVYVTFSANGKKLGDIDLRVDTRMTETPADRGMIRLAKGKIRPSSSRWYYLVYASVPLLVVGAWLFFRRR